jgi:hypothetical protein
MVYAISPPTLYVTYSPFLFSIPRIIVSLRVSKQQLTQLFAIDRELISPSFTRTENRDQDGFPPNIWIQLSLTDPCMFHAVLFAASSHLDVIRREQDNPITHYHRRHTVQLLLGSISNSGKVPSTSIAATMYLWHYEVRDHCIQLLVTA